MWSIKMKKWQKKLQVIQKEHHEKEKAKKLFHLACKEKECILKEEKENLSSILGSKFKVRVKDESSHKNSNHRPR